MGHVKRLIWDELELLIDLSLHPGACWRLGKPKRLQATCVSVSKADTQESSGAENVWQHYPCFTAACLWTTRGKPIGQVESVA